MTSEEHQTSRPLYELSSNLFALLRSSSPSLGGRGSGSPEGLLYSDRIPPVPRQVYPSPATLVYLLLGVSSALMIGGFITFFLGFMLMPWVLGLLILFYLAGIFSNLSGLGKAIFFPSTRSASK